MKILIGSTVLLILAAVLIRYFSVALRKKFSSDVYLIMYFFSLSFITSFIVAYAGTRLGAIDAQGDYQPGLGKLIEKTLHMFLDLNTDSIILFAMVIIAIVPQLLSYLLSGLLIGSTLTPLFIRQSISFFIWGIIKSLAVASGIALTFALFGFFAHWKDVNALEAFELTSMAVAILSLSLGFLHAYREIENFIREIKQYSPQKVNQILSWIHRWLIRHQNVSQQQTANLNK